MVSARPAAAAAWPKMFALAARVRSHGLSELRPMEIYGNDPSAAGGSGPRAGRSPKYVTSSTWSHCTTTGTWNQRQNTFKVCKLRTPQLEKLGHWPSTSSTHRVRSCLELYIHASVVMRTAQSGPLQCHCRRRRRRRLAHSLSPTHVGQLCSVSWMTASQSWQNACRQRGHT